MCLYPKLIQNPKYKSTKKNGGVIPPIIDERVKYVPIGCGNCIECRKKKARDWQARLLEEVKKAKNGKFVTLTFSDESIMELCNQPATKTWPSLKGLTGYALDNALSVRAVRLFTERWRKAYGHTIRHFLITELGHNGTENVHLHGILWTSESYSTIAKVWKYGHIWPTKEEDQKKNYVSERTVNYIIKYITKMDEDHPNYNSVILTSNGMGSNYINRSDATRNKYNGKHTNETFRTESGHKISMPVYWRNKIYTEEEREKLWLMKLDKQERWVMGEKVDISKGEENYWKLVKYHREKAKRLGYRDDTKDQDKMEYERQHRILQQKTRIAKAKAKQANALKG